MLILMITSCMSHCLYFLQTRSPGCPSRRSSAKLPSIAQRNQDLLKKHDRHFSSTGGQSVAAESWQSPDRASRLGSNTPDMEEAEQPVRSEASKDSSGVQEDSVLAKYVPRFLGSSRSCIYFITFFNIVWQND